MKKTAFILIIIGVIGAAFTAKSFFTKEMVRGEEHFSSDPIDYIHISGGLASVRVLPTTSEDITVKWKNSLFKWAAQRSNVTVNKEDSELSIQIGERNFFNLSFFGFNFLNKPEVEIYLPKKQFTSIVLDNDVGNTKISSVHVEDLQARTSVANLSIVDVQADSITAQSDVGNMTLENNHAKLYVKSDVGNISVHAGEIEHDMEVESDVGNINITVPTIQNNVSFSAYSDVGSVNVFGEKGSYFTNEAEYNVNAETSVGRINIKTK